MVSVRLAGGLHALFPNLHGKELIVEASTVADVVREVDRLAPGIAFYVCDELGRLRQHVNIFIEEERVVDRRRQTDPVGEGSRVHILQALSGG
jgi:sulfur carrier protein ThiS